MGLLERIDAERQPQNKWSVGKAEAPMVERHRFAGGSVFNPESYGNYLATSNDIYSIVQLRARLSSGLKLNLFSGEGEKRTKVTAGPVHDLLKKVNPFWTRKRLIRMDELSMGVWGETFWALEKDALGTPREIWWMKSPNVTPVPDSNNYIKGFLYTPVSGGPEIAFDADEVNWFRYPNPIDEFEPLSPLAAAKLAADTSKAMQMANRQLFDNGLTAAGIVVPTADKVTYSPEQADELEEILDKRLRGVDKAHRWAVLRFDAQFKELNVTPKDAEYLNGMNLTLRAACNAYGVPTPLMNDLSGATLANVREYQRQLWEHTLIPDNDFRAADITEQLLPLFARSRGPQVTEAEFDYSTVPALQESASEVWSREYQAIDRGVLTINEWRAKHGYDPVPWGDVYWAPVNKEPRDDAELAPTEPVDRTTAEFRSIVQQMDDLGERFAALNRQKELR